MFPPLPTKDKQICWSQGGSPFRRVGEKIYRRLLFSRNPSSSQDVPQNVPHPVMPVFEPRELFAMNCVLPVFIHASFTADRACFIFRIHRGGDYGPRGTPPRAPVARPGLPAGIRSLS